MTDINKMLHERGSRYGAFAGHAEITQSLKRTMQASPRWAQLNDAQREALEMVAHKIGRILNGDPNYKDSWTDIIGYTKLVEETLHDPNQQEIQFQIPKGGTRPFSPPQFVLCPQCGLDNSQCGHILDTSA